MRKISITIDELQTVELTDHADILNLQSLFYRAWKALGDGEAVDYKTLCEEGERDLARIAETLEKFCINGEHQKPIPEQVELLFSAWNEEVLANARKASEIAQLKMDLEAFQEIATITTACKEGGIIWAYSSGFNCHVSNTSGNYSMPAVKSGVNLCDMIHAKWPISGWVRS